jgi:bacteriorhodopsin
MGAATLSFMGLSFRKPRTHRLFHYITAGITFIAAIAYFSMASNLGQTPIQVEFPRSTTGPANNAGAGGTGTREIFYVRYIDWYDINLISLLLRRWYKAYKWLLGLSPLHYFCWIFF